MVIFWLIRINFFAHRMMAFLIFAAPSCPDWAKASTNDKRNSTKEASIYVHIRIFCYDRALIRIL